MAEGTMLSLERRSKEAAEQAAEPHSAAQQEALLAWQMRLLPFMTRFIASIAIVFLLLSVYDLFTVQRSVAMDASYDVREQIEKRVGPPEASQMPEQAVRDSMLLLEADALTKRYRQANALLLSRIWTKHLAFITGVLMALLGSVFVLGKMSESTSNIEGGNEAWKLGISSASPGIILAVLGTALLLVAVYVQTPITVNDQPLYVMPETVSRPATAAPVDTPPLPFPDRSKGGRP